MAVPLGRFTDICPFELSRFYQTLGIETKSDLGVADLDLLFDFLPVLFADLDLLTFFTLLLGFLDLFDLVTTTDLLFFGVFVISDGGSLKNVETVWM